MSSENDGATPDRHAARDESEPGLNELMIVNPASDEGLVGYFRGEDEALYEVREPSHEEGRRALGASRFFLGEDGSLYELMGADRAGVGDQQGTPEDARFFLGGDGSLYEVTDH